MKGGQEDSAKSVVKAGEQRQALYLTDGSRRVWGWHSNSKAKRTEDNYMENRWPGNNLLKHIVC